MSHLLVATPSAYLACASRSRQCTATSHSGLLITVAVAWPLTCNIGIAGFCRGPWKSHEKKIKLAVVVNRSPISAGHVQAPVTISRGQNYSNALSVLCAPNSLGEVKLDASRPSRV